MSTNGTLQLNQGYVQTGLGTLTFTVPTTLPNAGSTITTTNVPFVVSCQVTVPANTGTGFGAGSGSDQGLGATGGSTTFAATYQTTGAQQALGSGQLGLGFGGTVTDGALGGNGTGWGPGAGGGGEGFVGGDLGLSHGGVGQGFGAANGYPQPLAGVITPSALNPAVTSGLSIVVNHNGSPVYTAPSFVLAQDALQFLTKGILCSGNDTITVVFSSSTGSDAALIGIKAVVSVNQGNNIG